MKIDLSQKRTRIIFSLATVAFAIWIGIDLVDLIQTQRTRNVFSEIVKANEQRKRSAPNLESADNYVHALRAIDTRFTKPGLKPAFEAYVGAFEEGILAARSGLDASQSDAKASAAHRELVEIAERYK